ncbi:MAG: hypothetical protein R3F61_15995 [Myxococcota bacterium]
MIALWMSSALATSGPWVVGAREVNVYVGLDTQRLDRLQIQGEGGRDAQVIDVGEGLSTLGFKGIATIGVANRVDLELTVPWFRTIANRPDSELCATLGLDACETTQGIGVITARAKVLVLDQIAGKPFSLSVIGVGRLGMFTHPTRARITNLGEGTQDLGLSVSAGRDGVLGNQGFWSSYVDLGFVYRIPNTDSYPQLQGDQIAPHEEYTAFGELVFSPRLRYGFGPTVGGFLRPRGVDFLDADLTDPDRLAALRVGNLKVGGTLIVRADSGFSASMQFQRSVYAFNNPYTTIVTAGVSFQGRAKDPNAP